MHVRNCICIYACKQTQTHADKSACAYTCICAHVRTLDRILYTHTQFAQTNGVTTHNTSIWREDSRSRGLSLSRPVGRRAPCAQPGWCRSRAGGAPMGAGTEDAIGLELACRGGTARSGTSPGYLAAPGHHLRPVHHHARRVAQIAWLARRRVAGRCGRGARRCI